MKRSAAVLATLVLCAGCLLPSCSSTGIYKTWANDYRSLNARFARVAVFTDFTAIHTGQSPAQISLEKSLEAGKELNDQIVSTLTGLDYEVSYSDKLFIGSYVVEKMPVAFGQAEPPAQTSPPFHIDPDVSHKKSYEEATLQAFRSFAAMAAEGPEAIKSGNIDPDIMRRLSGISNSGAVVLAIATSRKVTGEQDSDGAISASRLYRLKMSVLCVGVFHGYNGKLLWYGQRTFPAGPSISAYKNSVRQMFSDFPKKGDGPYFAPAK